MMAFKKVSFRYVQYAFFVLTLLTSNQTPATPPLPAAVSPEELTALIANRLKSRIDVPKDGQEDYASKLQQALTAADLPNLSPQYIILVDRNPLVQVLFVYRKNQEGGLDFILAAPVSTGKPGRFDYFLTPTGVFEHTLANSDFRAEGTKNEHGIRGYGVKGMRVYDFGWVTSIRGWGKRGPGTMRLQMHATDPDLLENKLGQPQSKGCIRIPAELNVLIDHYGLLDADYEQAENRGPHLWVLLPDREPVSSPGRYLVVIDSQDQTRPLWLPTLPAKHLQRATFRHR